ncbi:MAG: DNA-binding protein [Clostridium sp.]|uniref:DNA-binding protein n=1 Tax=Clostridium TaxID=1485 RepID=UPI001D6948E1|nr:DNA-binding protein [Clostridium sp.]MBS5126414.1 DNA-binding protein [Clostridium sp.]
MGDLTTSKISRQNILNNDYAIYEIQNQLKLEGIQYNTDMIFTKEQIAEYFNVDIRTIERCIEFNKDELQNNGYRILRGAELKEFKKIIQSYGGTDINVGSKVTVLGIFSFRALLNISMILTESEKAKEVRSVILDIVIDVINKKSGGNTKYINQRDNEFLKSWFNEENYRKDFTDALNNYVNMGPIKYGMYTNVIYKNIFKEKADEYKKILNLSKNDRIRDTFYSEILDLIASYEAGLAYELKLSFEEKGRKLNQMEVDRIFKKFHEHPRQKPLLDKARNKMASRDLVFRDALHLQLQEYITPLEKDDYERFIGEKSKELQERLEEAKDVFKRLKEY